VVLEVITQSNVKHRREDPAIPIDDFRCHQPQGRRNRVKAVAGRGGLETQEPDHEITVDYADSRSTLRRPNNPTQHRQNEFWVSTTQRSETGGNHKPVD
jgi:hypothetical protein